MVRPRFVNPKFSRRYSSVLQNKLYLFHDAKNADIYIFNLLFLFYYMYSNLSWIYKIMYFYMVQFLFQSFNCPPVSDAFNLIMNSCDVFCSLECFKFICTHALCIGIFLLTTVQFDNDMAKLILESIRDYLFKAKAMA